MPVLELSVGKQLMFGGYIFPRFWYNRGMSHIPRDV